MKMDRPPGGEHGGQESRDSLRGTPSIPALPTSLQVVNDAFEAASEADRIWFEKHPEINTYIRPMTPGEIMFIGTWEGGTVTGGMVQVTQLAPGVRERKWIRIDAEAAFFPPPAWMQGGEPCFTTSV